MAAGKIRGITIELSGDTSGLSKSLQSANKDIKDTQTQLKDVQKLLKMDPGNVDLLKQKQTLLGDAVEETRKKLDLLKEAQKQMDAQGVDKTSASYMALQREIASTEIDMKGLEKASKSTNVAMEKIGTTASKVAQGAQKVADATRGLSAAAGGVVVALGGMAIKAGQNADELNTLSKQTGFSTETLQKFAYASDLVDVSTDDINSGLKKLKKNMASSSDTVAQAWEKIGVSTKNADGSFRDIEDVFFDTVAAMGKIENETERDTLAMTLFGSSADQLAGILDDGGAALKEFGDAAEQKGIIIPQEDLDKANELNDTLDELKATLSGSFGKAAIAAMQALAPVLETVAGLVEKVAGWISTLNPETVQIIATIAAVVAAISPIASIIATISTAISVLTPVVTALNAVMAANPIGLIVIAIGAVIAAVVALVKNWDSVKEAAQMLWEKLKEVFGAIKDFVVEKFNAVKDAVTGVFNNLKEAAHEKWTAIKDTIGGAVESAKNAVKERMGMMKQAFEENGGGIKGAAAALWTGVKQNFVDGFNVLNKLTGGKLGEIVNAIKEKFTNLLSGVKQWGKDLIDNFVNGIKEKIGAVKDAVSNIAQTVKDFLGFSEPDKGPLSNFHTFMPDMIQLMTKGIDENMYKVTDSMNTLASKLVPDPSVNVNYNDSGVTSRLDSINSSISQAQGGQVNVYLEGDAEGIFRVVKQETYRRQQLTGRNPLAQGV